MKFNEKVIEKFVINCLKQNTSGFSLTQISYSTGFLTHQIAPVLEKLNIEEKVVYSNQKYQLAI